MAATIRPQLTHAGLNVYDLDTMRAFYSEIMGILPTDYGVSQRIGETLAFFSNDPTKHHQLVLVTGRSPESKVSTVNQISFKLKSLDELREIHRRVVEYGVKNLHPVSHGNAWSCYFDDPEGNPIECYLDTPWYVAQPHGDYLDFRMTNEEIVRWTEEKVKADPSGMRVEDWQAKVRDALGQD